MGRFISFVVFFCAPTFSVDSNVREVNKCSKLNVIIAIFQLGQTSFFFKFASRCHCEFIIAPNKNRLPNELGVKLRPY